MNFLEIVKNRYSLREYASKDIEDSKLEYILECARLAPSAVNYQPWYFIVIKNQAGKDKLQQCYPREWFTKAPLYIIACKNEDQSWKRPNDGKDHGDIDAAIAIEHICLAATEQGLGSCWVCNFDTALCKELFNISKELIPVAIIPIGYPIHKEVKEKTRKSLNEIIRIED